MTIMGRTVTLAVGLLACLAIENNAYGANFDIPSAYTDWDNNEWTLSTRELIQGQYQSRLSLANGYLGCAQAAAGPFFESDKNLTHPNGGDLPINGWPLDSPRITFCTIANFWDSQPNTTRSNFPWLLQYGRESVISGVPHWGGIIFEFNGARLDADVLNTTIRSFQSTLSAKHGVATWSYIWAPDNSSGVELDITFTAFVSRARPNLAAIRADITASRDVSGTVTDLLDGRSAVRSDFHQSAFYADSPTISTSVSPFGLPNITAFIYSKMQFDGNEVVNSSRRLANQSWVPYVNRSTIAQAFDINLRAGQTTSLYKFVGGASSDAFPNPAAVARNASDCGTTERWNALLDEHQAAWESILPRSAVDDYSNPDGQLPDDPNIKDIQISSVMSPYYLLQNTLRADPRPNLGDNSISVGGLTSESYAGLIFWDADLFMSPGLVVSHPEYARQIADYRIKLGGQAHVNALFNGFSSDSVIYSWTSGRFGNCTGTGPCVDYQYHLNGDIALGLLQQRNVTGDETWWREQAWPIYNSIAQMYSELVEFNQTSQKYGVRNMTDPVSASLIEKNHDPWLACY